MTTDISTLSAYSVVKGFLTLMRPLNTIVTFIAILSTGVMAAGDWSLQSAVIVAAVAGMLITAAGNIINDVFDQGTDKINRPDRPIAAGVVSPAGGAIWAALCACTGVLLSVFLGTAALLIAISSTALLFAYSAGLKRIPFLGNIIVALLTALAFVYGGFVAGSPMVAIVPGIFAFTVNIGREIIKDIEDMPGDRASAINTLPLLIGKGPATGIAVFSLLLTAAASIVPWITGLYSFWYMLLLLPVNTSIIATVILLRNTTRTDNLRKSIFLLKLGMLTGIAALTIGSL